MTDDELLERVNYLEDLNKSLEWEIKEAHDTLSRVVGKEHWTIAGRIELLLHVLKYGGWVWPIRPILILHRPTWMFRHKGGVAGHVRWKDGAWHLPRPDNPDIPVCGRTAVYDADAFERKALYDLDPDDKLCTICFRAFKVVDPDAALEQDPILHELYVRDSLAALAPPK